jgi:hypothetical protein
MEDQHEKTFAAMRANLSGEEMEPPVFDPDGEAQMYLRVMADGYVVGLSNAGSLARFETLQTVIQLPGRWSGRGRCSSTSCKALRR